MSLPLFMVACALLGGAIIAAGVGAAVWFMSRAGADRGLVGGTWLLALGYGCVAVVAGLAVESLWLTLVLAPLVVAVLVLAGGRRRPALVAVGAIGVATPVGLVLAALVVVTTVMDH